MGVEGYDFAGWASKNDLLCQDGRIIRRGAFAAQDGQKVPLVYDHEHKNISNVVGHAILENRDDGVYAYGFLNNTPNGQNAKEQLKHGDITALSIWANNLVQSGRDVMHGVIREVSLVLGGANPGAFIESVVAHGMPFDSEEDEAIIYTGDDILLSTQIENPNDIQHAAEEPKKEEKPMADGKPEEKKDEGGETVGEIYDAMTQKQKDAVAIIVGQAIADAKGASSGKEEEGDGGEMNHSVFDQDGAGKDNEYLSHADQLAIIKEAKAIGSLREAIHQNLEDGQVLCHSIDTTGMTTAAGKNTYFFNDPDMLFPDYKSLNNPPEWISRNMDWVTEVMGSVHHTPFTRIKSVYADITEEEARARGYITGKQKKTEVFTTLKRTTGPTTIYKLQKADRDTILDITEFDVIAWIRAEMRVMLNEEIARAILIGDGRQTDSDDHIDETCIRPIVKDVPLFNVILKVTVPANATQAEIAEAIIDTVIRGRKKYKGSGSPKFFTTDDVLTEMLLLKDKIGHKIYKTEAEVTTALRVSKIVPVEPMTGQTVEVDGKDYPLIGCMVNLTDYNVGTDKGGQIENFEDFDIDFNKYSYLIETRMSGALVKPYSAVTVVLDKAGSTSSEEDEDKEDEDKEAEG